MSYKAPSASQVVEEVKPAVINLAETSADTARNRNKKGMLSTFLQGSRNQTAGALSQALNKQPALGNSNI